VPSGVTEVSDIELGSNGDIYLSLGIGRHGGIWRKNALTGSWTKVGGNGLNGLPATAFRRIELATAPNNANVTYALLQNQYSAVDSINGKVRLFRSENITAVAGVVWREIPLEGKSTIQDANNIIYTGQGDYSIALAVAPDDDKTIYFGNIEFYRGTVGALVGSQYVISWNEIANRFGLINHGTIFTVGTMHPDIHQIIFQPGSSTNVYIVNDGGVYRTEFIAGANPIIVYPINNNLRILQYYTCAMSAGANTFDLLGGTQDNDSHQFSDAACLTNASRAYPTGDGGFCFINPTNSSERMVSSYFNDYYRSTNGGASYTNDGVFAKPASGYDKTGRFINPTDWAVITNNAVPTVTTVNMFSASNLYSTSTTEYQIYRWNNIFSAGATKTILHNTIMNGAASVIKVSPNNPNTVYVGIPGYPANPVTGTVAKNARIIRITNANNSITDPIIANRPKYTNITSITIAQEAFMSCIEIRKNGTNTDDEIIITYSNFGVGSVFYTNTGTNALPDWIPIDNTSNAGTLPDMPIRWAIFPPTDEVLANTYHHKILLATEVGVWGTMNINGLNTVWQSINNGALPNVRTQMLRIRESDNMVLAATHGRGMWRSDMYSPIKVNFATNVPNPNPNNNCPVINFISCTTGAVSYAWDLQNDGITDSNLPSLATNCYYRQQKLTINGNACVVKENLTSGYFCANACIYVNPVDQRPVSTANTDLSESVILIYPNPNTGIFTIQSTQKIQNVWITDIAGRVILDIKNPENTVNLSDYPAGVYICTIMTENGVRSAHKIIKE
jgi:trimeric autotransporter adhesin